MEARSHNRIAPGELGMDSCCADGRKMRARSTADGWWLLRASNTQAVLVARCEAEDQAGLSRLKEALVAQLRESGIAPPDF